MDSERAYNISDLFILKMDLLKTVEEVLTLPAEMIEFYTREMASLDTRKIYSKPVTVCLDYIFNHLHEKITVSSLAKTAGLTKSYLSTLFKNETDVTVTNYILSERMETAKKMLKFSEYSFAEVVSILAFSSQNHFIRTFKKYSGYTPKEYRNKFFASREN